MKQALLLLGFLVSSMSLPFVAAQGGAASCVASESGDASFPGSRESGDSTVSEHGAVMMLDTLYLDLGLFPADSIATGVMRFRNTGDEPLVVHRVIAECGCTVPGYSSTPVPPGETGEITVRFNGKGRSPGTFTKAVRIRSNARNPREIFFVKGKIKRIYRK